MPAILLALALAGCATAFRIPLIALFATRELGLELSSLGIVNASATIVSVVVVLIAGGLLHQTEKRLVWGRRAALALAMGSAALFAVPSIGILAVVSIAVFSAGALPQMLLLAVGRDATYARGEGERGAAKVRAALSAGYVAGPVLVAFVLARASARASFIALASVYLLLAVATQQVKSTSVEAIDALPARDGPSLSSVVRLAVGLGLTLVVDTYRAGFMAVHATRLGASPGMAAAIFATTGLSNLVMMPLAGGVADRVGLRAVVLFGGVAGAAFAVAAGSATSILLLAAAQVLHSVYCACVLGAGIGFAHQVMRSANRGVAVFQASNAASGLLGHFAGGVIAERAGLGVGFHAAAAACVLGAIVLATIGFRSRIA